MADATSKLAPVRLIRVAGGNLFAIAAQELGDATQWNRIAQINKLVDPWLVGSFALQIPPTNPNAGGGILGSTTT